MSARDLFVDCVRRLNQHISASVEVDGLWIGSWEKDDGSLAKIRAALELIATHDPRRYARIRADLRGIWAILLPGGLAHFAPRDDLCEIDLRYLKSATPEDVASAIVHEATHARLWHRGYRYEEGIRGRIEAICFRQEKAFASRLPDPGAIPQTLEAYLALDAAYFSDQSQASRHRRGSVAALREMKAPNWLIGWQLRSLRRQQRRRRRAPLPTVHRD